MSLEHLFEEIEINPYNFTWGLYAYIHELRDEMYAFVEQYCRWSK